MRPWLLAVVLGMTTTPTFAVGQDVTTLEEIVVQGERAPFGIRPERTLDAIQLSGYGQNSIGGLLAQIDRNAASEPIYLVNGRRVSGLGDIETYPTEALEQIQILPIGSAVRLGQSPDRRVVNLVLKLKLRTVITNTGVGAASEGGAADSSVDIGATDIERPRRANIGLIVRNGSLLRESERDVLQAAEASPDLGRFRSLRPQTQIVDLRVSAANRLTPDLQGSFSARLSENRTMALIGQAPASGSLRQRAERQAGNAGWQLDADIGNWLVGLNGSFDLEERQTRTQRVGSTSEASETQIAAQTSSVRSELTASGPFLPVSAGTLSLSATVRASKETISAEQGGFDQTNYGARVGVQLPIASASQGLITGIGELSASVDVSKDRSNRFGTFTSVAYGVQWQPISTLNLAGSTTTASTPPGAELLAAPQIETPGVRYLDPLRGDTVDVVEISGGNSLLPVQRRREDRLSLSFRPFKSVSLLLNSEYSATRERDTIASLPAASEEVLRAFQDRFTRDVEGRLIRVDIRPVSFARSHQSQFRNGLDLTLPIDSAETSDGFSFGTRQVQISLSHSFILESELELRPGSAPIDLLSRDAVGLGGLSRPRHDFDLSVGYSAQGVGVRLNAQHRSSSQLSLTESDGVLTFSPLTTVGLTAFVDGSRFFGRAPWLAGTRLSLTVNNLGSARQAVIDERGGTPLRYQPAYNDPLGQTVFVELRKAF